MLSLRRLLPGLGALALIAPAPPGTEPVSAQPPAVQPANQPGEKPRADQFNLLPGFQVEKLYTVPKDTQGSWVALTVDPKGRLIAY